MIERRWIIRQVDRDQQIALASMLSVSPITASVLLARGVATKEQADQWLSPHQTSLGDPFLLPAMEWAIDRMHRAVAARERMCFYGDYDVDGISATSLYVIFFRHAGADVCWYIPDRLREGYGLNEAAIRGLVAQGVTLLVTSDCGTTSHREIETANALGMDVIVTDHHQSGDRLPPAYALLNPHRSDSAYPFTGLCSAGLAYKVVTAYQTKYGDTPCRPDSLLDLVALATIADIVPLQDENRGLVRTGLNLLTQGARCGIRALKRVAGVEKPCTSETVAFRLAPRINAAGRLAHGAAGVRLLTTESDTEAAELAAELEELNRRRQFVEEEIATGALATADPGGVPAALVVWDRAWHVGVVGIVASRLVERYHCPAVVVAVDEHGIGKGSARGIPGFDLYQALVLCQDLLERFGGHPSAAGLTIHESRLPEFRQRFTDVVRQWLGGQPHDPVLHVDAEVSLRDMAPRLIRELELLHPFGAGNPEPTFAVKNLTLLSCQVVGDRHLKLTVRQKHSLPFESIGFRMGALAERGLAAGRSVDLAFMPELQRWNGLDRIQLKIRDVQARPV
ncbi:MAG TPA: single-stranded-DNA-specific exonuclease RecJ [Nitrospiraceae bacterium]|nr:single-stranded-DNA-specific exonuclease RecJ [Nitrospiraceae bacterium]